MWLARHQNFGGIDSKPLALEPRMGQSFCSEGSLSLKWETALLQLMTYVMHHSGPNRGTILA